MTTCHARPNDAAGIVKPSGSWCALKSSRKLSSCTGRPSSSSSRSASPFRNTANDFVCVCCQSSSTISWPSGLNQAMSPTPAPRTGRPLNHPRRRNAGCPACRWMRRRVNCEQLLVDVVPVEPRDLVVLAVGVVVPALRAADLVAAEQHRNALREEQRRQDVALLPRSQSTLTAASSVGPSAPQFHDRLWLSPSLPFSPFASLCFSL